MPDVFVSHGTAARLTELRMLGDHAFRDFRHVWNKVGTKPHRIWRASLALFRSSLSSRTRQADKQ
jgi:hypothetical protein